MELLNKMQIKPDSTVWRALLAECKVHRDVTLAEWAAEKLFGLVPNDAVPYILLSNLYSSAGRWEDVARIRSLMKSRGVSKESGCSWIEVGSIVHVFHVEDREHPRMAEIYAKVEEMIGRLSSRCKIWQWRERRWGWLTTVRSWRWHLGLLTVPWAPRCRCTST